MAEKQSGISVKFGYVLAKELAGFSSGTTGWWGARVGKFYGHAPEQLCPTVYDDSLEEDGSKNIPFEAFRTAMNFRDSYYQRLYTPEDFLHSINMRGGCLIEFDIFENISKAPKGKVSLPVIGEKYLGSHAVFVAGYNIEDESDKHLIFINSWGRKWGDNGVGYLPLDYFEHGLVNAGWSSKTSKIEEVKPIKIGTEIVKTSSKERIRIEGAWYPSLRRTEYKIGVFDIYSERTNFLLGCIHASPVDSKTIEIEELFVLPQYHRRGIASKALKHVEKVARSYKFTDIVGWIGAQDLVEDRGTGVLAFFTKNGYSIEENGSRFKDAVYKFSKKL